MAELPDRRPSPDALLDLAQRETRGKLKIFVGASPGVGKTYAMLAGAHRLKREGKDVLVGVVETHGRGETAALLEGLDVLPRRRIVHRGHELLEFDLDAALARQPQLVIIDELAHSNAPDCRHPKRYQDVEELIAAGIDVWTALNIQHVESLADVVASITGVKVRELVPDTVIESADDVVVVDITPDELMQRLREGKVYLPENALRAAENFLKPSNITALRELALRKTAQRVDDQMVDYLRQQAIEGPWPTAERLLVCVGSDPWSEKVVRTAARMASGLNASWIAVHVARSNSEIVDATQAHQIDHVLDLSARLGAETKRVAATDLVQEVLRIARGENITQIIIGKSPAAGFFHFLHRSLADEIIRHASGVSVHVIPSQSEPRRTRSQWPRPELTGLAITPFAVAFATVAGLVAKHFLVLPNVSLIFLTAVLFCAVIFGTWSAVIAAVLSFLAYNFFFIEPVHTFTIASPHELLALFMFLLVAIFTGGLAGRVREQKFAALRRVKQVQALFDVSRKLSGSPELDDIAWIVVTQAATILRGQAILLMKRADKLGILAALPPEDTLGAAEQAAARWADEHGEPAGWGTATLPNAHYQFRPLRTSQGVVGVVGVHTAGNRISQADEQTIEALLDQAAIAIERSMLSSAAVSATAAAEREKLRSALLSSLSHDLRTPLSSILGSVTTLRSLGPKLKSAVRDDLLANIEEETTRLSRFVSDLLDMTRLEGGAVESLKEKIDLTDLVTAASRRARTLWPEREISIETAAVPLTVMGDSALLEQLIFNLLENAHKYTLPGTPTVVSQERRGDLAVVTVEDQGVGIPASEIERIFEKFHRVKENDGRPPGTGLGLAICRAIAQVSGGTIRAESPGRGGKGSRFVVALPLAKQE